MRKLEVLDKLVDLVETAINEAVDSAEEALLHDCIKFLQDELEKARQEFSMIGEEVVVNE